MKILQMHNYYQDSGGGETAVVDRESALLREHGHTVSLFTAHNDQIKTAASRTLAGANALYSRSARRGAEAEIEAFKPDIVHIHNYFPLLSPSVYYACKKAGVPVIQSVHNYRMVCPGGQLLRDGRICEICIRKKVPWPGIVHGCYKESPVASAVVAAMLSVHHFMGTWREQVDAYIAPCDFVRSKLAEGGVPQKKLTVKPNFVDDSCAAGKGEGGYALYVGRLGSEKGVDTLLAAWEEFGAAVPLVIAGVGPMSEEVRAAQAKLANVKWLGWVPYEEVKALMANALFLIVPSKCYESFGLVIIEAFSVGTPVIASSIGAMQELVGDGRTGLHFRPGDAKDLSNKINWAITNPDELRAMRPRARAEFELKYTAERNYAMLVDIYERVLQNN